MVSIEKWNKTLFLKDKNKSGGLNWFLERIERSETLILDLVLQLKENNTFEFEVSGANFNFM
ncbi:hypothetical protein [Lacinutrix sp.]|uniref:hypothetical protein n=1 Tax=Lacinutrix sp. TaxID=1937692 RepID=UPI0034516A05